MTINWYRLARHVSSQRSIVQYIASASGSGSDSCGEDWRTQDKVRSTACHWPASRMAYHRRTHHRKSASEDRRHSQSNSCSAAQSPLLGGDVGHLHSATEIDVL